MATTTRNLIKKEEKPVEREAAPREITEAAPCKITEKDGEIFNNGDKIVSAK